MRYSAGGRLARGFGLTVMLVGVVAFAGLAAEPAAGPACDRVIRVTDAWARPAAGMPGMSGMGGTSAVYFTLRNNGDEPEALIGVQSDVAKSLEVHETRIENNVARMVAIPRLEVPAGGQVQLRPGGLHIMVMGLQRALRAGDRFTVELLFERCGKLPVEVVVGEPPS